MKYYRLTLQKNGSDLNTFKPIGNKLMADKSKGIENLIANAEERAQTKRKNFTEQQNIS